MAMITKNHGFVDEEWKDKIFTEYRCYEGNFYTRAKKLPNSSKSLTLEDISFQLGGYLPYPYEGDILLSGKLNDVPSGRLFRADLGFLQMCQSL